MRDHDRSFRGDKSRLANAAVRSNIYGSSLFPMGEQTKPILSFGGIDRSWASSRDESLRERLRLIVSARGFLGPAHRRQIIAVCDQQTPPLTPETISRRAAPTFRHLAKLISGSSSDRAYKESPGRVSDRARSPDLGLGRQFAFTLSPTGNSEERDLCRHHHRAFARSVICGALNLREISATSAFAEIAPPPFRMSPTDSGLRRLGKGR